MTKTNKIFVYLVIVLAIIILFFSWQSGSKNEPQSPEIDTLQQSIKVNLLIEDFIQSELEIEKDSTVFDVLELINQQDPTFNLQTKTYEGLGILVEQLGDKINGQDNKYWQYYVNDEQPMLSADQYILENNDKIEWYFKESEF